MTDGLVVPKQKNSTRLAIEESIQEPVPLPAEWSNPHRPIRLLLVITRLTIGGDTNVVLDLAQQFNSRPDFEVHLAVGPVPASEVDLTYLASERGVPITVIPSLVNRINPWSNFRALVELYSVIRSGQFDIVHTHSSVAGIAGRIAAFAARVPVIVHHVHGWGLRSDMSGSMRVLYLGLERLCAKFTDRLVVISKPNLQKGLDYRICGEDKFTLIYNGICLQNFRQEVNEKEVRTELGLDPECKLVGMIGRLDEQKNPLDFIRAAAVVVKDYPDVQFLIAGHGSLQKQCEELIDQLHLSGKFFLLGYRNDIARILPILNLTVLSSLWEGLPIVFLEAMSAGKPIVANNVDGASDLVIDGETGYLVTPLQPQELAEKIRYLLENEDVCRKMGIAGKQASENYSIQQMITKMEALYRGLLATSTRGQRYSVGVLR